MCAADPATGEPRTYGNKCMQLCDGARTLYQGNCEDLGGSPKLESAPF